MRPSPCWTSRLCRFLLFFLTLAHTFRSWAASHCESDSHLAGAAKADITGPFAEVGMMGYAEPSQRAQGLHMRLYSRSLVVRDPCTGHTVALVINDMGMIFYGLKQAILQSLAQELPHVFSDDNLLLSATHTHAGPGGYAHHTLYNITTMGFQPAVFEAFRAGTVRSIMDAYKNMAPARMVVTKGEAPHLQWNRSKEAYAANPAVERARYAQDHDPTMVQLNVMHQNGAPLAVFNWFAIHPVSLPLTSRLVSGDNKGLAAYLVEKHLSPKTGGKPPFVAGFVQESAGDISPYPLVTPEREERDGRSRNQRAGQGQAAAALGLWHEAASPASPDLWGPVTFIHQFVDVARRPVGESFAGPSEEPKPETCHGALGVSFAAGTENGQPLRIFREGTIYGRNWPRLTLMPQEQACQGEKVILLPTGLIPARSRLFPVLNPWTARIVPFQIVRIGSLAIVAAPFEVTTMAGRRLREAVLGELQGAGVETVVISTLANEYLHYVTTREEYRRQAYEGGSNLFGPWSLAAYTEILTGLAHDLRENVTPVVTVRPPQLSPLRLPWPQRERGDRPAAGTPFGTVLAEPAAAYKPWDTARAAFACAHPNHHAPSGNTYLTVEKATADGEGPPSWETVRTDDDPDTVFDFWRRRGGHWTCQVQWDIGGTGEPGTYRLCHRGTALLKGESGVGEWVRSPYEGCSAPFLISQ